MIINTHQYMFAPEDPDSMLIFKSLSGDEFSLSSVSEDTPAKLWDGTMYYSTDARIWQIWDGLSSISSSEGRLYVRGLNNTVASKDGQWKISFINPDDYINCSGNIETLLDWQQAKDGQHPVMGAYAFSDMFSYWIRLLSAPELRSLTMKDHCYVRMFEDCRSLTSVPALPAMTLAPYCYTTMFSGCTALTSVPADLLPATTLAVRCYMNMFHSCFSLTVCPRLPATTLTEGCYARMFENCTNLDAVPALNATYIPAYAYAGMFDDCSKIYVNEPDVPDQGTLWLKNNRQHPSAYSTSDMLLGTAGYTTLVSENENYYVRNTIIS